MLAITEGIQIALITTLGLVLVTVIPLLLGVRKRLDQNVGKANGEGNLVDMTVRLAEQVGMVRAEQVQVRSDLGVATDLLTVNTDLTAKNKAVTDGILAVQVHLANEVQHVHEALKAHLDDHLAGKSWEVVVREKKTEGQDGEEQGPQPG